jgi:N-methylhydantoinase A
VFSAFGLLFADIAFAQSQGLLVSLDEADPARLGAVFEDIEASVLHHLARPASAVRLRRRADLRYAGQAFELTVDVPDGPLDTAAIEALSAAFDAEHARSYGHSLSRTHKREIVALRVVGTVGTDRPESRLSVRATAAGDGPATRSAYFGDLGWRGAAIVGREALTRPMAGPLIVEEPDSTTIVPPGWTAMLDHKRNIIIDQDGELPQ